MSSALHIAAGEKLHQLHRTKRTRDRRLNCYVWLGLLSDALEKYFCLGEREREEGRLRKESFLNIVKIFWFFLSKKLVAIS